jgi:hypothetical protein
MPPTFGQSGRGTAGPGIDVGRDGIDIDAAKTYHEASACGHAFLTGHLAASQRKFQPGTDFGEPGSQIEFQAAFPSRLARGGHFDVVPRAFPSEAGRRFDEMPGTPPERWSGTT